MRKIALGGVMILALFGAFPISVSAAVLASQSNSATSIDGIGENLNEQTLGTGLSGLLTSFSFYARGGTSPIGWRVFECTSAAYDSCVTLDFHEDYFYFTATSTKTLYSFDLLSEVIILNPLKYYKFGVRSGANFFLYGNTDATSYSSGQFNGGVNNIKDMYFVLDAVSVVSLAPQVYSVISPTQFQITSSATVPISFTYLNTTLYNRVGIELIDQTNNNLILRTGEQTALQSGLYTYSAAFGLTENHAYRVRGYLSVGTSSVIFGPYRDFSTVSDQFFGATSSLINIIQVNDNNASSSLSGGLNAFLSLTPSFFSSKFPFNWFFDIATQLDVLSQSTSTDFFNFGVDFPTMQGATTTGLNILPNRWVFLSTTTVSTYLSDSTRLAFRDYAGYAMILGWLFFMWRRVSSLFNATPL